MRRAMAAILVAGLAALAGCGNEKPPTPRQQARERVSDVARALELFKKHVNRYPTAQEGLKALINRPADAGDEYPFGGYLQDETSFIDPWDRPFVYEIGPDGKPRVICYGSDGAPGGTGDAEDIVESPR